MAVRVELLGIARVVVDNQKEIQLRSSIRDRALAYLAYSHDWVSRDRLGFLFWADTPDQTARHNVRQLLKRVRRLDWLSGFEADPDRVRWLAATDVEELRSPAVEENWDDLPASGVLLPGFERGASYEFEEWLLMERQRVLGEWQNARMGAADSADRDGRPDVAARLLRPVLDETEDETVLVRYMDRMARAGDLDGAINAYQMVTERMRTQLGVEPTDETQAWVDRLRERAESFVDTTSSPIVGRTQETNEILGLLARPGCRLLTLLGPGGIGKSTLADVVAKTATPRFADGTTLVSLESLSDPDAIPSVIAAGLGIGLDSRLNPLDQVASALGEKHLLLVVDNVEHLPHGWGLLSELAKACPQLKVLVTSRERLRLEEEWVYEIEGLTGSEAVELFAQRARQVAPDGVVKKEDALSICELVGGSPLGIELAAPWLRVMSPREIVDNVVDDVSLLSGGSRDKTIRHRSVEATMAHSWRLASGSIQEAIEALSVFAAPYTLELALEVAGASPEILRDLIDKSLVRRLPDGRYTSHPLVRQYAASRLAANPDQRREVRVRHARALLPLLDRSSELPVEHDDLIDDLVEAWRYAVNQKELDLVGRSTEGIVSLIESQGRYSQGLRIMNEAYSRIEGSTSMALTAKAAVTYGQARLLYGLGRHAEAANAAEAALEEAAEVDIHRLIVQSRVLLGWARKWIDGDPAQFKITAEALPSAETLGDDELIAIVRNGLGCSAPLLEDCRQHLQVGLGLDLSGKPELRCMMLTNLGLVSWSLGDDAKALKHLTESLAMARQINVGLYLATCLANLAFVHSQVGLMEEARAWAREAESVLDTAGVREQIYTTLIAGEIARLTSESPGAWMLMHRALEMADVSDNDPYRLRAIRLRGQLLVDEGHLEDGLPLLAFVLARTDRRGDFTCEMLNPKAWNEAICNVPPETVRRAQERATELHLDFLVAESLALDDPDSTAVQHLDHASGTASDSGLDAPR